jgi:hypothetical protein
LMITRIHRSCWVYCPQHHVNKVIKNPLIYIYIYIYILQGDNLGTCLFFSINEEEEKKDKQVASKSNAQKHGIQNIN